MGARKFRLDITLLLRAATSSLEPTACPRLAQSRSVPLTWLRDILNLLAHDKLRWVERPLEEATGNATRPLKEPRGKSSNQRLRERGLLGPATNKMNQPIS